MGCLGALCSRPDESGSNESHRMENKEGGVKPLLGSRAVFFMDEFVFRNQYRREDGKADVNFERERGVGDEEDEEHADECAESIERMADPFPEGKSSSVVKDPLIESDCEGLQNKGEH